MSARESQALLEKLDRWLATHDRDANPGVDGSGRKRAGVGIYYFEHAAQPEKFKSVFHSLWWAVTTLTTVGYGDMFPITAGGKLFTFLVLTIGLGIVAVPTGLVASALTNARREDLG